MKSEPRIELIEITIANIELNVSTPYEPDEDNSFTIEFESTWSLSENKKMYSSFPTYTFEATNKKTDQMCLMVNITYFCAVDRNGKTLVEVSDVVTNELRQYTETILVHNFVKDLNDLLTRAGYPRIHFWNILEALKESN